MESYRGESSTRVRQMKRVNSMTNTNCYPNFVRPRPAIFRCAGGAIALLLGAMLVGCGGGTEEPAAPETARTKPSAKPAPPTRREIWLARMLKATEKIEDPEDRSAAASLSALALADSGEYEHARRLIKQFILPDRQDSARGIIAYTQSLRGQIEEALATVSEMSTEKARDSGLAQIVHGLVNCDKMDQAQAIMRKIKEPNSLDMARLSFVEAHAQAGDLDKARAIAAKIVDEDVRESAASAIAKGKIDKKPAKETSEGGYAMASLGALLQFSSPGPWRKPAAAAMTAGQQKNNKDMDIQIAKTLDAIEHAEAPAPSIAKLSLCMALLAAERIDEAKAMAHSFQTNADGEVLGISGLFGKPVLAYLFTVLGMEDQLDKIRVTKPGSMLHINGIMQAVGAAEAEMKNWAAMEKRYAKLTPIERVDYACGVLIVLQPDK